jgi:hypothetical protein
MEEDYGGDQGLTKGCGAKGRRRRRRRRRKYIDFPVIMIITLRNGNFI